jgi:rhodanese-related sulfurtransferase
MESSSYLITDEKGNTPWVCTGDCLFIGDVGRPDLAVKTDLSEEDLAGHLFDSLRNKIMTLPDDIIIYPNHGAGSACGKSISSESFDTLGNQKKTNYALRADMTKEEFIKEVLTGLKEPPLYFPNNVKMNKGINTDIDVILQRGNRALDIYRFKELSEHDEILVIDTRSKKAFTNEGTVPGAWYIGIDGSFAPWVGTLIKNIEQKIIFIADPGREQEVVTRFSRVGYDFILGYLKGGIQAWKKEGFEVDKVKSISASEFEELNKKDLKKVTLDIRKEAEFESGHLLGALNFPLEFIHSKISDLDPQEKYFLHCASGYRSLVAASIFKAKGVSQVVDIAGGFKALEKTALERTDYVCPTNLS